MDQQYGFPVSASQRASVTLTLLRLTQHLGLSPAPLKGRYHSQIRVSTSLLPLLAAIAHSMKVSFSFYIILTLFLVILCPIVPAFLPLYLFHSLSLFLSIRSWKGPNSLCILAYAGIVGYLWCDCDNQEMFVHTDRTSAHKCNTNKHETLWGKIVASICLGASHKLLLKANNNRVKSANLFPQPLSINYFISKQCKKDLTAFAVEEFVPLTYY